MVSSPAELRALALHAKRGERFIYIVGRSTARATLMQREAWELYRHGIVNLYQKRMTKAPDGVFQYIAERR